MRRVLIAGGGFCGAATAAALLRTRTPGLQVMMIDRTGTFGRGVAYSTTRPEHLLNVAAGKMSALPDDPGHFVRWAQAAGHPVDEHSFVPRHVYGDYVQAVLADAERDAPRGALECLAGEVTAVEPRDDGTARVRAAGRVLEADAVVLALGVSRPEPPAFATAVADHDGWIGDPWDEERVCALAGARSVLVLGTGMTMADVALTLGGGPSLTAVSRRGELPRAHTPAPLCETPDPVVEPRPGLTADALAAAVEEAASAAGAQWRGVVDSLRPVTAALWRSLAPTEQAHFVRRHARRWEVHRSRLAPDAAARITELRSAGTLRVEAAHIHELRPTSGGRIAAELGEGRETLTADAVINAAGPAWDCRRGEHAVLRVLIRRGHAAPGPVGLGLRTADDGALLDAAGRPSRVLFTLGALRRGELWESVAVPELSVQACELARRLAEPVALAA